MAKPLLKAKNGPLIAGVASVAVAAVVIGSAIAYWQSPDDRLAEAAPLPGTRVTVADHVLLSVHVVCLLG